MWDIENNSNLNINPNFLLHLLFGCVNHWMHLLHFRYCFDPTNWRDSLVGDRTSRHTRDLSISTDSCANLPSINILPHHVTRLQYDTDIPLHVVCLQDQEDSREFQRSQVHWIHHVFHLHCLACFPTHLFRHQQWLQGKYHSH